MTFKWLGIVVLVMGFCQAAMAKEDKAAVVAKMVECSKKWDQKVREDNNYVREWLVTNLKFETCNMNDATAVCWDKKDHRVTNIRVDSKCLNESKGMEKTKMFGKCVMIAYNYYRTSDDGSIVCNKQPLGEKIDIEPPMMKVERADK